MNQIEPSELIPTRNSLIAALHNWDDQYNWRRFFDTYWRLIYSVARRAGLTNAEAEEVVQETVITVAKSMRQDPFRTGGGSFKGWLLNTTRWRIQDQFRKRARAPLHRPDRAPDGGESGPPVLDEMPTDLEKAWEQEWNEQVLHAAIERVKAMVSPEQFQMFDLYVIKEQSAAEVASFLRVSKGQVYLAKLRVSRILRKEITELRRSLEQPS